MQAIKHLSDLYHQHTLTQHETLPRVPIKQHTSFPRVAAQPMQQSTNTLDTKRSKERNMPTAHRYPRRHQQAPNQDQAHHVITIKEDENSLEKPTIQTEFRCANTIIDPDAGTSMEYRHLLKSPKHRTAWTTSFANELGRLVQGVGSTDKGTNTIYYIRHDQVPENRRKDVTYRRICVDY
jgi:hypothetical protein